MKEGSFLRRHRGKLLLAGLGGALAAGTLVEKKLDSAAPDTVTTSGPVLDKHSRTSKESAAPQDSATEPTTEVPDFKQMRFSPDRLLEFPQKETRYSSPDGRFSVESTDMLMTKKLQDPEFRTRYEELVAATKITVEDADRIVVDVNEGQTSRQLTLQVEMNLPGESDGYPWRVMADEEGFPAFYFQVLPGRSVEEQLMDSIKNWLSWKVEAQQ